MIARNAVVRSVCAVLMLLGPATAAAQSVRGRVLDAESGAAVASVRVELLLPDGVIAAAAVSGSDGGFQLAVHSAGEYRLQASHLGYRTATTSPFRMELHEQLLVDVTISAAAIPLEPLSITGRRRDPRHDPSVDGFYARQLLLPPIGSSRILTPLDPELASARDARDVLTWLAPSRVFRGTATTEGRGCLIIYWNGNLVPSEDIAELWLETPTDQLEGIEYYRTLTDAPLPFRTVPLYLMECPLHSVLALWSRTGYYGAPVRDLTPGSGRMNVAAVFYRVAGSNAPDAGAGFEVAGHWPVSRGIAAGLVLRRTGHNVPAATTEATVPEEGNLPFVTPPGRRPMTLWTGGLEGRLLLPGVGAVRPVLGARLLIAHRTLTLQSTSQGSADAPVTSWGRAVGVSAGAETMLLGRFALNVSAGHDRLFFDPYDDLERRWNPTASRWGGTSLRIGFGYAIQR
ncbi:MAG TPA: carboxypeptidase-like regulatory domain-containing protein [Longimicrobiales bacterium]|nr:carboxypeptidase-like regulatory domain-containing protein [Longimicrobiales bacterium]